MKIFILFNNDGDDYNSLPNDVERVHIFHFIKGAPNIDHIQKRLTEVLDNCNVADDFIIFNGPSYLCALAGYVWFTQPERKTVNFYAYNVKDKKYITHTEPVES
jgi:hypothetical protein